MKRVVTSEEMRWCDENAMKNYGIPGLLLMENAGHSVAELIRQEYSPLDSKHIYFFCGKGNNAGDGFVIARLLSNTGARLSIILLASPSDLQGDARINFKILQSMVKKLRSQITIQRYSKRFHTTLPHPDIVVDAIFGTGFIGSVRQPYFEVIEWINQQPVPIVAVDIPSGVNGTTGVVENLAVHATTTVTFDKLKSGLLCNQGRETVGSIRVVDIGLPRSSKNNQNPKISLVEQSDIAKILPKRSLHAHKYNVGKVFVLAGSKGLTGAAALCSTAVMKAGAGAVILGVPESVYPILARKLTEVMTFPLPATTDGTLSIAAFEGIRERLAWADVLVVGPGLSQNLETQQLIMKILSEYHGKALIDADGLNAVAARGVAKLRTMKASFILTPHVGECARLTGLLPKEIEQQRIAVARDFSKKIGATIVLKGAPTVTASKDGNIILNSSGNPGMATAGAGDVLSGIIAGLWAQGMSDVEAAWASAYLHGLSGDIAAAKLGERSLVANDLLDNLNTAIQASEVVV